MTLEAEVLVALDPHEGTEAFNLPGRRRQSSAALQRLRRKGLAEAARCPDGAWVWFAVEMKDPLDTAHPDGILEI